MFKSKQSVGATLLAWFLVFAAGVARGQVTCVTCPADAVATAVGAGLTVQRANGTIVQPGQSVGACETLNVLGSVAYQPQVLTSSGLVVGSGFFGGTGSIAVNNGNPGSPFNVTPADMATTTVGPAPCGSTTVKGMNNLPYTITAADAAAGSVTFSFQYSNGRSLLGDCTLTVSASAQFTAQVVGLPSCTIAPASTEVCAGGSATFTASSTGPAAGAPHTFTWTGPGGFSATGPTITINNAQAANGGTYDATITDVFGCTSTCSAQLIVHPNPTCVVAPATQEICIGASATFTVNVSSGTAPFTITWTGPGGFTGSGPTITINNAQVANSGTYTANVTDSEGCTTSCSGQLNVVPCAPNIEVTKEVACFLPGDTCGTYAKVATGVRDGECPAFCYRITVTNAGNVVVTSLTVTDTLLGNISAQFASALPLVIGESVTVEIKGVTLCQDTRNTVTANGQSAQGLADVDTDFADAEVLNINLVCELTLFSSVDLDENPNNNSVELPVGSLNTPVEFNLVLRNTGTSPLTVTNITGLPALVDCTDQTTPVVVTLPFDIDAGGSATLSACVLVSCPGAQFSVQAHGVASDEGGTLCVFDENGNRVSDSTAVCPAVVTCEQPVTCRVTGGGVLLPGTVDQSCIEVGTTIFPLTTPNGLTINKITHGGQLGAPFSQEDCGEILGNPCIRGQWSHTRHYQGTGNPRDVIDMNFHSTTPKGIYDSLNCACLGCCDPETGAFITPITVGSLCNPDDHKVCGPEPRPAPANAIIWSGIGKMTPEDDVRGSRAAQAEWVVFRIYIEDRSEPGGHHPGGAIEPADIYCFQAWKTGIKVSKKPDFSTVSPDFRRALGQANCDFLAALQNGTFPIGTLPPPEVGGVTADIQDCGPMSTGNHQIHPSTSATCNQ
jgi:hypothetical protein